MIFHLMYPATWRTAKTKRLATAAAPMLVATAAVGALMATAPAAHAQSIGIAFGNLVLSTDSPGIVSGTNFNDVSGGSGTILALNDDSGSATTANLTFSSAGTYGGFNTPDTANAGTNRLYSQGLYGSSSEVTLTVSNIPYAAYDVYVYASADSTNTSTLSDTDGTTTFYYSSSGTFNSAATSLTQTASTDAGSPTAAPAQYQLFHEAGSTFSLTTGGSSDGSISNNVFGVQIVNAAAPEPSALMLLLPGAFGFLATRCASRKRN